MDFCERVEDRNSRRAGGLRKPFFCHVIYVSAPMQFLNDLVDLCLCGFHHRCLERLVVLSDIELHFGLLFVFVLFMMTVVVPLSAFLSGQGIITYNRDWWEVVWGRSNLPQKNLAVLSEPKFGPPPPPQSKIPGSAPAVTLSFSSAPRSSDEKQLFRNLFN